MIAAAKVRLPWGALHVETAGAGTPLLLVSGLNGLAAPWHGIMPALAGNFRVIAHDHRGLGGSDGWQGPWSVDQIASDVIGLMDGLGIARAHLVGHSLGGAAAQAIAADHPERVAGLVIYASWAGPDPYFARVMRMRQAMLRGLGIEEFLRTGHHTADRDGNGNGVGTPREKVEGQRLEKVAAAPEQPVSIRMWLLLAAVFIVGLLKQANGQANGRKSRIDTHGARQ